jgi:hypothetical protein
MVSKHSQFGLSARPLSTGNGADARLRPLGRGRTAARHPIGFVGRVVRGQTGSSYWYPSSWRAADDRLCPSGTCAVRWGAVRIQPRAQAGDFIHVPTFPPHMEINPSNSEPFHWRS